MKKIRLFISLCAILSISEAYAIDELKIKLDNAYKAVHGEKVWSSKLDEGKYLYIVPTDLMILKTHLLI